MELINTVIQIIFDGLVVYFFGWKILAYLVMGTLLAMGLHPVAGKIVIIIMIITLMVTNFFVVVSLFFITLKVTSFLNITSTSRHKGKIMMLIVITNVKCYPI